MDATRKAQLMPKIIICVLATVFFCVGWGGLVWNVATGLKARNWVQTQGVVKSSTVASHRSHSRRGTRTVFSPLVTYDYAYQGTNYHGERFSTFQVSTSSYRQQKAKADRYHRGDQVQVWVDPANPKNSVLERQLRPPLFISMFFSLFGLVGTGLVVVALRQTLFKPSAQPARCLMMEKLRPSFPGADKGLLVFSVLWNVFIVTISSAAFFGGFGEEIRTGRIGFSVVLPVLFMGVFVIVGIGMAIKALGKAWRFASRSRCEVVATCAAVRSGEQMQVNYAFEGNAEIRHLEVSVRSVNRDLRTTRRGDPDSANGVEKMVWNSGSSDMVSPAGSFAFELPQMPPAERRSWSLLFTQRDRNDRTSTTEYKID